MKKIFLLLASLVLVSVHAHAQSGGTCSSLTLSATGRVTILSQSQPSLVGVQATYYTTGGPASVSVSIEAGNVPAATQTPIVKLGPTTNTTGADMGNASGAFKLWFVNVATLSGGTTPTIALTYCFSATALSRSGGVSGLTAGTIPKAASSTTLTDSLLSEDGATVQAAPGATIAADELDTVVEVICATSLATCTGYSQIDTLATAPRSVRWPDLAGTPAFTSQIPSLNATTATGTAQVANVSATNLLTSVAAGRYRLNAYVAVTTQASTTSSVPEVNLICTDPTDSVAKVIQVTPAIVGVAVNPATTVGVSGAGICDAKVSTNIQYSVTGYASVGGTAMQFKYYLILEAL